MRSIAVLGLLCAMSCARVTSAVTGRPDVGSAPASFVRTTAESRTTRIVAVREGLSRASAFHQLTEALSDEWTIDVSDARAGFAMTTWQASVARGGVPDLRYRTRIVARFLGADWRQLAITAEANWQNGDEWDVGYDSRLLDAAATELTTRLGPRS